ncbi:MAG: hypothetical protein M1825_002213 [Sarcosagium campestre]|nr:MAG: hypothetical protein M1825_002213 [Sarcosagium campestre]
MSSETKSKAEIISERQANLPLPEQPPVASDWNSADARNVNVGSGRVESDKSTGGGIDDRTTGESSARVDGNELNKSTAPDSSVGRQGKDNLDGLPKDALAREAK